MIRMTIYAGSAGRGDPYEPCVTTHLVAERDVSEKLRTIGLEWRQADYFPDRQTVITLDPVSDDGTDVKALVREAASKLERTGLL